MTLRLANKKDSLKLLRMFNSDRNLTGNDEVRYTKGHISEYISNPVNKLFLYTKVNKIVGALLAEFWKKAKYVYINILIVDKKYRGGGVGSKLIEYVEDLAKKQGMNLIFMYSEETDKPMHNLSNKLNYQKGKKSYFFSKQLK